MPDSSRVPFPVADVATAAIVGGGWTLAVALLARSPWWHPSSVTSYHWTGVLLAVAVAARRRWPVAGFWLVLAGTVLVQRAGLQSYFQVLPLAVASFAVVRAGRLGWLAALVPAVLGAAAMTVAGYPELLLRLVPPWSSPVDLLPGYGFPLVVTRNYSELVQLVAIVVAAVVLGHVFHRLDTARAELEARNAELVRLQGVEADRAVTAERNRIARDLHDVVAHHVTAIVVRAQAARHVLERRPETGPEALGWIAAEGKEALGAMRSMVHVLRVDAPTVTTANDLRDSLHQTVERLRAGGLDVTLAIDPAPAGAGGEVSAEVGAEVGVAVVRIAQEALTNVALHSAATSAAVTLGGDGESLVLTVTDPGPALAPPSGRSPRGGNGVRHMTDRAAALGGEVSVGPDGTGWRVAARLPHGRPTTGTEEGR
ncbi:sensor histidine kinase [Serinibacter arcticus]|uniref:sensor histidine kinase n=1 Tax=Serinibacter arcticus TaxID=1655435 RepID=UPI001304DA0F|nr:histidine kinase [Serinibacter arcticus]